ncbi:MAG: EI24 domain-containing protein [Chitinophagaceae bacterium]|nr:EI24 domain-containing protein [Chitinophagaceae bacterium]
MLKEIVIAIEGWEEARLFIKKHRLFRWILIPGIIYTILFFLGMWFFFRSADSAVSWMSSNLNIENWLQKERSEWLSFLFVMTGMMLRLILVLLYFSFFKYVILILGSPLFAFLSEKTESSIEGKEYSFKFSEVKKDCLRNITLSLRNCGWQTVYLLALVLLSLVPLVGWITPVIALLMEGYYFGFSMLDYSFARVEFSPSQSVHFMGRHKGLAIGNGLLFYVMHALIVLAPAYAIIAATLSVHKMKNS